MAVGNEERLVDNQIVLHFELADGKFADTKIVAEALLKWVSLVQEAVKAIEPDGAVDLEIIGNERGSLRFLQTIRFIERGIENIDAAWTEYPYIKKAVIGSAHVFATGIIGGLINVSMVPTVQTVELSSKGLKAMADMQNKVTESTLVQTNSRQFYQIVERDPAIVGVGVAQTRDGQPIMVPRSEFQTRSGLWTIEEDTELTREKADEWDVVILKAPFSHKRLSWQFSRDGLPFNAVMDDAMFLSAVKDGRVPINLQEGVVMRVQIAYVERLEGQVWKTDSRSRRIVKVISPKPLPAKP
jgi:hypothetical protein